MADKSDNQSKQENDGKGEALETAVSQIEKQFGSGAIMRFGDKQSVNVETFPSGSLSLDIALGGGVPKGRIVEVFGPEASGKTTLALHMIAESQRQGGTVAFVDAEHALDPEYSRTIGVNLDNLLISQPDTGEQALEITETLVRSSAVDVVVVDSVAALVPKAEIEGEMGDAHVGLQARLMSQALRKLAGAIAKSNTTVVFINQLRQKIGVMFGNPETTPGGQALKYYSSVRIEVRRTQAIKHGEESVGNNVKAKVVKNKVSAPFKVAEFDIMYNEGISGSGDLLDLSVKHNLVKKSGAWYEYDGEKIGQGREAAKQYLKDSPQVARKLEKAIRKEALGK
jgi:recombination protein RecA